MGGELGGAPTLLDVCSFLGMGREGESGEQSYTAGPHHCCRCPGHTVSPGGRYGGCIYGRSGSSMAGPSEPGGEGGGTEDGHR